MSTRSALYRRLLHSGEEEHETCEAAQVRYSHHGGHIWIAQVRLFPSIKRRCRSRRTGWRTYSERGPQLSSSRIPLGKSQELSAELKNLPLVLNPTIAANNAILKKHGYDLPCTAYDPEHTKPPFVYITSGLGKDAMRVQSMRKHGAKTAAFSGCALDRGFASLSSIDEAFPISDHCGYNELMEFVRRCSPSSVFTTHGFAKEFSAQIRRNLGFRPSLWSPASGRSIISDEALLNSSTATDMSPAA